MSRVNSETKEPIFMNFGTQLLAIREGNIGYI